MPCSLEMSLLNLLRLRRKRSIHHSGSERYANISLSYASICIPVTRAGAIRDPGEGFPEHGGNQLYTNWMARSTSSRGSTCRVAEDQGRRGGGRLARHSPRAPPARRRHWDRRRPRLRVPPGQSVSDQLLVTCKVILRLVWLMILLAATRPPGPSISILPDEEKIEAMIPRRLSAPAPCKPCGTAATAYRSLQRRPVKRPLP
jgi:hypothetical protein